MTTTPQDPDQDAEPPAPDGSPTDDGDTEEPGNHLNRLLDTEGAMSARSNLGRRLLASRLITVFALVQGCL
jgi:hypothetical protein